MPAAHLVLKRIEYLQPEWVAREPCSRGHSRHGSGFRMPATLAPFLQETPL